MADHTAAALRAVERARMEAMRLAYPFVQREQLFLGLLQEETVSRILTSLGLDLQSIRQQVEERVLPGLGAPETLEAIGLLPTAEQVFRQRAQTAAALLGHTHVGTEHILLGFLLEQHGVVVEVLTAMGISQDSIIAAIKQLDIGQVPPGADHEHGILA
jgi:ATP-dependent Clp protease ATP-binding subunit ClpC